MGKGGWRFGVGDGDAGGGWGWGEAWGQACIRRESRGGLGPKNVCTKIGPIRFSQR